MVVNGAAEEKKPGSQSSVQEPERTPPAENSAAWVEKYVAWASHVLMEKRAAQNK